MSEFRLFKFWKINKYLIESIVNSSIYCAPPDKLNDPFDCQVDILRAVENAKSKLIADHHASLCVLVDLCQRYIEELQKKMKTVAICSFSKELENSLMWSHYADEHKGLCVSYEFPEEYLNDPNKIIGIVPVEYGKNPLKKWFSEYAQKKNVDRTIFMHELIEKVLTIKGNDWGYEKEWRIIRANEGNFSIEKNHIKRICFGLNTPKADIDLVMSLVVNAGYQVKFSQIERCQNSDFGITAKEI